MYCDEKSETAIIWQKPQNLRLNWRPANRTRHQNRKSSVQFKCENRKTEPNILVKSAKSQLPLSSPPQLGETCLPNALDPIYHQRHFAGGRLALRVLLNSFLLESVYFSLG